MCPLPNIGRVIALNSALLKKMQKLVHQRAFVQTTKSGEGASLHNVALGGRA